MLILLGHNKICVQSTNRRKVGALHGSPKFSNSKLANNFEFDKSPSVIGGQRELFGDITGMIDHWKEMEGEEKQSAQQEGGGVRRKSERMSELCGRFEEGEKEQSSQTGGGKGRGESNYISFKNSMNDISVRKKLSSLSSKTVSTTKYSKSKLSNNKVSAKVTSVNKSSPLTKLRSKTTSNISNKQTDKETGKCVNHENRRE